MGMFKEERKYSITEDEFHIVLYQAYFFGVNVQQDKLPVGAFTDWTEKAIEELKKRK